MSPELMLGPLLRYVDSTSATIWVETSAPCTVTVLQNTTRTFSIEGRHYALVIVAGLEPATVTQYQVHLDGAQAWPLPDSTFPPSVIRTGRASGNASILVGSCRAAAPHEAPYNLELAFDTDGRGVDTLWAHAHRMYLEPNTEWPDLLLLLGDQIYADDSSPEARKRIESRGDVTGAELESEIVGRYEEYRWLYLEAWSKPWERWLLSTVPSAMIFDDHDMIDDWNISASWVHDIRTEPWWERHVIDGLMSYFVYQHLGNVSPDVIAEEGLLEALVGVDDGTELLRQWATGSEQSTPHVGGYRFSYCRSVGDVSVVVIDCRNARVLSDSQRLMVGPQEWDWVAEQARAAEGHLVLATSVPVYIPDGLHDLQAWNERLCDGRFGDRVASWSEKLRRSLDLEDWSAFGKSYQQFASLVDELRYRYDSPRSIVVASGDIHFSYAARVPSRYGADREADPLIADPPVWQIVSSPIRNALIPHERSVLRLSLGRLGRVAGDVLRRSAGLRSTRPGIAMQAGPLFANNMVELHYRGSEVEMVIEQSTNDSSGTPSLDAVVSLALAAPSS